MKKPTYYCNKCSCQSSIEEMADDLSKCKKCEEKQSK
jgi:hypothetical protein